MKVRHIHSTGAYNQLCLEGRMDVAGVNEVEGQLMSFAHEPDKHLLLDLSGVTLMGSLGVRLLLNLAKALQGNGRELVLFGAQETVAEVVRLTKLGEVIPVCEDEVAARARVKE